MKRKKKKYVNFWNISMEKPVDRSLIVIDIGGTNIRINHVDCITKTADNKTEIFPSSSLVPTAPVDALIHLINAYIEKHRITADAAFAENTAASKHTATDIFFLNSHKTTTYL